MKHWQWMVAGLAILLAVAGGALTRAGADPSVEQFLQEMYLARSQGLVTRTPAPTLDRFYDLDTQGGRFALVHEEGRISYMQSWAAARSLKVAEAETLLTNVRVKRNGDRATVSLIARTRLAYGYDGQAELNQMGVGSWHWLQLSRSGETWKVQKEFYLDAMGSELTEPYQSGRAGPATQGREEVLEVRPAARGSLDRTGAIAYAEKYCGAAWGCGNNSDYNERYQSYRNLGGDCANFASQTLVEGGKLKPDWVWRYDKSGSACWVNAESFVYYLVNSGRATLLARGTYPKVLSALPKLRPGDIVGYQSRGTITHVSVVTGQDSSGVPLVAAHTADRYRNPWDLGWDKRTIFWIVHLRD